MAGPKRRCEAPLPTGGTCQRRELHVNLKCSHHGGEGPLLRVTRKAEKDARQRAALVKQVTSFVAKMKTSVQEQS